MILNTSMSIFLGFLNEIARIEINVFRLWMYSTYWVITIQKVPASLDAYTRLHKNGSPGDKF